MFKKSHLATFAALALALALAGCDKSPYTLDQTEVLASKNSANEYARGLEADVVAVSPTDSYPPDGYVTATFKPRKGGDVFTADCAYKNFGGGCKPKDKK